MSDYTVPQNLPTCPRCGSTQVQVVSTPGGSTFSAADGVCSGILGFLCLGPIGLLCTLFGVKNKQGEVTRMCLNCGNKY